MSRFLMAFRTRDEATDKPLSLARPRREYPDNPGNGGRETDIRDIRDIRGQTNRGDAASALQATASLASTACAIGAALANGAEREDDPDGWLLLIRPDGARLVVAPNIVAELDAVGLLPALPEAMERSTYGARARPAEWWDGTDEPKAGDRCRCGGAGFWAERDRLGDWRCSTCHPPPPGLAVTPVQT